MAVPQSRPHTLAVVSEGRRVCPLSGFTVVPQSEPILCLLYRVLLKRQNMPAPNLAH